MRKSFLIHFRNISESRLAFQQAVSAPDEYHQSDSRGARAIWGLAEYIIATHQWSHADIYCSEDELVQELGSVEIKEGRCICFPNIYQVVLLPSFDTRRGADFGIDQLAQRLAFLARRPREARPLQSSRSVSGRSIKADSFDDRGRSSTARVGCTSFTCRGARRNQPPLKDPARAHGSHYQQAVLDNDP